MTHFAVSAIGRDRPGIVEAVSHVLLEHGVNVEDSQMTILRGHFTMMLIVAGPEGLDARGLEAGLQRAGGRLDLEAISLSEVAALSPGDQPDPSHIVTVYGADHPGILYATATALAARSINVTDLNTRLVAGETPDSLYAMMLEVAVPAGMDDGELKHVLEPVGAAEDVEVSVRRIESDVL